MIKITEEFSENKSRKSKDKNTKGLKNTKRKKHKIETAGNFTSCFL